MPILLTQTQDYSRRKLSLNAERRQLLELREEAIAADPDGEWGRARIDEALVYDYTEDFLLVAYKRLDQHGGELVTFMFLDAL